MGGMQRRKGAIGEREIVQLLNARGLMCHRTAQRMGKAGDAADVVCAGMDLHLEVKRTEKLKWKVTIDQCVRDAKGKPWVILHRANGDKWMVIQTLDAWLLDSHAVADAIAFRKRLIEEASRDDQA